MGSFSQSPMAASRTTMGREDGRGSGHCCAVRPFGRRIMLEVLLAAHKRKVADSPIDTFPYGGDAALPQTAGRWDDQGSGGSSADSSAYGETSPCAVMTSPTTRPAPRS